MGQNYPPPQQPQQPPQYQGPPQQYPPPYQQPQQQQVVYVKKRSACLPIVIAVVVILVILGAIGAALGPKASAPSASSPAVTTQPQGQAQPANTAAAAPAAAQAPSYAEIAAKQKALTDAQWQAYKDTLKGDSVSNWTGKIIDVGQEVFSDKYNIQVNMDPQGGAFPIAGALVETTKDQALKVSKGQTITFSGTIRDITCIVTYCPIQIVNATYTMK